MLERRRLGDAAPLGGRKHGWARSFAGTNSSEAGARNGSMIGREACVETGCDAAGWSSRSRVISEVSFSRAFICAVEIWSSASNTILRLGRRDAWPSSASRGRTVGVAWSSEVRRTTSNSSTTAAARPWSSCTSPSSKRGGSKSSSGSGPRGSSSMSDGTAPPTPTPTGDAPSTTERIRSTSISSSSSSSSCSAGTGDRRARLELGGSSGAWKTSMLSLTPNPETASGSSAP
mmetsp:Transcript_22567/g.72977  ORF Transcript_22567/g.72977 Transcript_22567/m.72977 type:complete len:232 (+) Transcript_22567:1102-1797(+)